MSTPGPETPHAGGRPTKYEPRFCDEVEAAMGEGLSLAAFAGLIGVARSTINEWMEANPEFSEAVSRAKGKRLLHWERAALKVSEKGGGPGTATVIVFGLKNMGGDEWMDVQRRELSGPNGAPIQTEDRSLTGLPTSKLRAIEAILSEDADGDSEPSRG